MKKQMPEYRATNAVISIFVRLYQFACCISADTLQRTRTEPGTAQDLQHRADIGPAPTRRDTLTGIVHWCVL